ncbi:Unknown protein [Striga hermonthica]|uniref:EF-hand domain-containing protein n=1 Tax=Striga hermonthica TaxID=68872 RepID=A0A9N7R3P6_STRHE|nr:Unknown protein [Striga hermonthica]
MAKMGQPLTYHELSEMMREADTNGDDIINFTDFASILGKSVIDYLGCPSLRNSVMDERARLISGPSVDCYQSSCRNCGYLLDNLGPKHAASEKPSILANCSRPTTFYKQDGDSLQSRVKFTQYKIPFSVPVQRNSEALPLAFSSSIKAESGIHTFQARASGSLRPKAGNVSESKNFSSKAHLPVGMENDKFGMEKRISYGLKDPVPPGRKRRPANVSRQVEESAGFVRSQRNFGSSPVMPGKHANVINDMDESRDNVAPFSFTSPVKYKYGVHEAAERRNKYDSHSGGNGGRKKLEKPLPLTGDALGALLQQKLKELNYEKDGFESKASGKTTSMILQELICALTTEKQRLENNLPVYSDRRSSCCNYSMLVNSTSSTSSQDNAMAVNPSVEPPLDSERLSPGSVLESYFSAESCHSTSLDESLASINNQATNNDKFVNDIVNHVSEILSCDILASHGPKGKRLDQAEEALLNSELILHNASISDGFVGKGCPIKHLIIDELETLMSVLWMNFGNFLGVEDGKEEVNQLKIFVFDSVIEYLGERFGEHCEFGSSVSRKLPLRMNMNTLIFEIVDVVRRWDELSRYDSLDKLVEREMGFSVKDWTECENEGFETGLEISRSLLQVLVDEVVVDLWTCVS